MIVDSYIEHLLNPNQDKAIGILPNGLSREEFIVRLDILLRETFPEMTFYKEAEYRCGKVVLLLTKKYCFGSKSYGNAPKSPGFQEYFTKTEKMLDEELGRMNAFVDGMIPVLDYEKAFTIISNGMQLLSSVIAYQRKQKEKEEKNTQPAVLGIRIPFIGGASADPIEFTREDTAIENVIQYLDDTWEITKRFTVAKANPWIPCEALIEWNEFKYLKMILQITKMRLDEIGVF